MRRTGHRSDRGALPEVVGDAALIAAPDPGALSNALQTVVSDEACAQRLRAAGPLRARELGWDRTAAGWLSVLRLAAGRDD